VLELKNVFFSVEGAGDRNGAPLEIIKDLSLTIEDDKFTVITGPNGGGKSTLAKLIMGVEIPTAGHIIFDGTDITAMPIDERAKLGIGYGFQQPARFKGMTVRKLLALAANKKMAACECNDYLSKVGLCSNEYLNREVDKSLSGGELKRIEIATILARDPKLAIYDEPEAGIDLWSFDRLTDTFRQIHEARDGRSIVIISHQERIIDLADEIVLIKDGGVAAAGPKETMLFEMGFEPVTTSNPNCVMIPHDRLSL
jgi:Fe-S cluster assembly ATP-binding protein